MQWKRFIIQSKADQSNIHSSPFEINTNEKSWKPELSYTKDTHPGFYIGVFCPLDNLLSKLQRIPAVANYSDERNEIRETLYEWCWAYSTLPNQKSGNLTVRIPLGGLNAVPKHVSNKIQNVALFNFSFDSSLAQHVVNTPVSHKFDHSINHWICIRHKEIKVLQDEGSKS